MKLKDVKIGMRVAVLDNFGEVWQRATVFQIRSPYVEVKTKSGSLMAFTVPRLRRLVPKKKRKPRELWVNFYGAKCFWLHQSKERAVKVAEGNATETAVKFREVIE